MITTTKKMASADSTLPFPTCPAVNAAALREYPFDIYVGTSTGFLKGCRLDKQKSYNINTVDISQAKQAEITSMNFWKNDDSFLLTARRDGSVFCYQPKNGSVLRVPVNVPSGTPSVISIRSGDEFIATAFSNGVVGCNKIDLQSEKIQNNSSTQIEINAGTNLSCMDYNSSHLIATGGKENSLKIWDLTSSKQIFTAKNVKNDWLNLRVPIWVTHAQFLPDSSKVVTSTGYSQIRLYDPLTPQRRPVIEVQCDDKGKKYPITALAMRPNSDLQFLVGTTVGTIAMADLRKKSFIKKFKGSTGGGIVDLKCHPTYPIFATCGMDSYLHCFDLNTYKRTPLYLHSTLNCLLFSSELSLAGNADFLSTKSVRSEQPLKVHAQSGSDDDDDDIDDVWKKMEVVEKKKRKLEPVSAAKEPKKKRKNIKTINVK